VSEARHLAWLREQGCCIADSQCSGPIHAHHVRRGTGCGMGKKPSDLFAVPLCASHHALGHQIGWQTFEAEYGIDLLAMAGLFVAMSPFLPGQDQAANARRAAVL
jgi:hypothetical protein